MNVSFLSGEKRFLILNDKAISLSQLKATHCRPLLSLEVQQLRSFKLHYGHPNPVSLAALNILTPFQYYQCLVEVLPV